MIIGTVCLILGVVGIFFFFPLLFWTIRSYSNIALFSFLACMVFVVVGLSVGLTTYDCSPDSPIFQFMGPCQGGVPWP